MRLKIALLPTAAAAAFLAGCGGGGLFGSAGGSLDAFLSSNDWIVGNGFYADRYVFRADSDGQAVIDLESNDFDAYLLVIDENNNVLEDDDSGPGSDARLSFQVFDGETFEVRATSYDPGDTGAYRLKWNGRLAYDGEIVFRPGAVAGEKLAGPSKRKS